MKISTIIADDVRTMLEVSLDENIPTLRFTPDAAYTWGTMLIEHAISARCDQDLLDFLTNSETLDKRVFNAQQATELITQLHKFIGARQTNGEADSEPIKHKSLYSL